MKRTTRNYGHNGRFLSVVVQKRCLTCKVHEMKWTAFTPCTVTFDFMSVFEDNEADTIQSDRHWIHNPLWVASLFDDMLIDSDANIYTYTHASSSRYKRAIFIALIADVQRSSNKKWINKTTHSCQLYWHEYEFTVIPTYLILAGCCWRNIRLK